MYQNRDIEYWGYGPDDQAIPYSTTDEQQLLKRLRGQIDSHRLTNKSKHDYYEACQSIKHLDIAVPRVLADIGTAVGWGGTVVDVIDERIDFLGWVNADGQLDGLDDIAIDNDLKVESGFAQIDSLTTGTSFVSVGNDEDGRQLISVESSDSATVIWDYRKRRSIAGLSQTYDDWGRVVMETLYTQDANVTFERDQDTRAMVVTDRDQHNMGRCFMTRLPNRSRPKQREGRSEITRAVRYYTDAAVRTALGMEVNREFYTAPQRMVLNAKPEDFGVTKDMTQGQKFLKGLSVAMGMVNIIPPSPDDTHPVSVVEFKPAPPTPYIEQIKAYSVLVSAETGMPVEYFGFTTDNPPSADSIRQREYRLVKRASRRIGSFGMGWKEVGLLSLLARDGDADIDFMRRLRCEYADPSTPTRAATADEISKLIAAKVLVPDSAVTYRRVGLDEMDQVELEADKRKQEAKDLRLAMQQSAIAAAQPTDAGTGNKPPSGKPQEQKAAPKTSTGSAS